MKYNAKSEFLIELLQKILLQTLDAHLTPLEKKVNQEMIDLKYLKDSSQQILTSLSLYSSTCMSHQRKLRPKVIVIKKNANRSKIANAKSSSPSPNNLNQTSRILNTKGRMTIKPNKPSISHDKITRPSKLRNPTNVIDYPLTRAPTMKSFTPVSSKRIDKSTSNTRLTKGKGASNKKITHAKVINKTNLSSTSNTSTPGTTPKRNTKKNETIAINFNGNIKQNRISNYFGDIPKNVNDNDIDDMFLMQDKFNLTDIRFSKIPFLTNNNTNYPNNKSDHTHHNNSVIESDNNSNALALGDQLETNWDLIGKYISTKEMLGLTLTNKQLGVNIMSASIIRIEYEIEQLDEEISRLKLDTLIDSSPFETNPNSNNSTNILYEFNPTTQRAINLLNETSMDKIFLTNASRNLIIPCDDILTIYRLYFSIIQHKVPIIDTQSTKELFWKETCAYFSNRSVQKLGLFIENEIKNAKMTNEMIYRLDLFAIKNHGNKKLSPTYYQNMCNVTGIFVFVIKDVMDQLGIGKESVNDKRKVLKILNSRLEIKNKILMKLNNINERYLN